MDADATLDNTLPESINMYDNSSDNNTDILLVFSDVDKSIDIEIIRDVTADIFVVGGGGAGGGTGDGSDLSMLYRSGGGGAGQVNLTENIKLSANTNYTITVGSGGLLSNYSGTNGSTSSFVGDNVTINAIGCLLYTSPSPRD